MGTVCQRKTRKDYGSKCSCAQCGHGYTGKIHARSGLCFGFSAQAQGVKLSAEKDGDTKFLVTRVSVENNASGEN